MNKSILIRYLNLYFLIIFFLDINSVFLNKYLTPEIIQSPILSYRKNIESTQINLFFLTASDSHNSKSELNSSKRNIFEFNGPLNFYTLDESQKNSNSVIETGLPSEWLSAEAPIYMALPGKINVNGFSWNVTKNVFDNLIIGWNSGFVSTKSALKLEMKIFEDKIPLKEGILFETFKIYRDMTKKLGMNLVYENKTSILDQDFFLRYSFFSDFYATCRKISCDFQAGLIVPTSDEKDVYNPSSISTGTNGHYSLYGAFELDFLLKEGFNLGFLGKLYNQFSKEKIYRLSKLQENPLFGSIVTNVKVSPGLTSAFSTYLSIEGLREGLGCKVSYTTFNHYKDDLCVLKKDLKFNQELSKNITSWAQEHIGVSVFYDFMRNENEYQLEPFLCFNANIPINFFFSNNSTRCYSISLSLEILY